MKENQSVFIQLRNDYPTFIYNDFDYMETDDALSITYHFEIPELAAFHPSWSIAKIQPVAVKNNDAQLEDLIFSLGMAELVSYWKLTCAPTICVHAKKLTPDQINWWIKLYTKGLGEFFYTNGITTDEPLMCINNHDALLFTDGTQTLFTKDEPSIQDATSVLVPIGGGKDSAVTLELLKNKTTRYGYIINPRQATIDTAKVAGLDKNVIIAKRKLDAHMLNLNTRGFLNGHTPFSAIVAFSSLIAAYIHQIPFVALSNESSANEPTVAGTDVNHQYSKSFEFERDFIEYELTHINSGVRYFSLLRPITELQIARLFSHNPAYFNVFKSCNAGSKTDAWCGQCPKCLFVYIILSPFIENSVLTRIFNRDLLNDGELTDTLEKLTGIQLEKPFECVGSRDEVKYALQMTIKQYTSQKKPLPLLLDYYSQRADFSTEITPSPLQVFDHNHSLPQFFLRILHEALAYGGTVIA